MSEDLVWRNLIADWHLRQGMPDCGCDDDTGDMDFCALSIAWAEDRFAERDDPALAGPSDKWDHDVWRAAWGRNAPLIASDMDYRLPKPPAGMSWLMTRLLVGGQTAVELVLLGTDLQRRGFARVVAEPTTIMARARVIVRGLSS